MTERHLVSGAPITGEASQLFDPLNHDRQLGAIAGSHGEAPAQVNTIVTRSTLQEYAADVPAPYLDHFARLGGERALQKAEAYLGRLGLLQTLLENHKIGMPDWVRKEVAFKYQAIPLTRASLLRIQSHYAINRSYLKEGIITPWMIRGSANAYEDEATHVRVLKRMRNLIHRGYFMETADPLLIEKREAGLVDRKSGKGVVATDAFLAFQPGECASIMHAYDLYGFLGQYPLSADRIATWWGIADPQHRAELLIPYVDAPANNEKSLAAFWNRLRYRLLNGFEQQKPLESSNALCKTIMVQLRHNRSIQYSHDLSAPTVVNCIRHAVAILDGRPGSHRTGVERVGKLIEDYLRDANMVNGLHLTEAERYPAALHFGSEYCNQVIDSGSERLVTHMTAQAVAIYGVGVTEEESAVQAITPPDRTKVSPTEAVVSIQLPPIELSQPPELPAKSPKTVDTASGVDALETGSTASGNGAKDGADDDSPVRLPYQIIKELPHPERAAIYTAHCLPWLFDKSMRQEYWHDVNRVLLHFNLESRGELINFVQEHLMPDIREKVQCDLGIARQLSIQHILARLNS